MEHNIQHIVDAFTEIGYTRNLIKRDCEFTDFLSTDPSVRRIHLGVFGQEPLDYRSACFGVHFSEKANDVESVAKSLRSFGASQFFIITNGQTERWTNAEKTPVLKGVFPTDNLAKLIREHRKDWNPDEFIRFKLGNLKTGPQQLDFVDIGLLPALEHEASEKIDSLIKRVLEIIQGYHKSTSVKIPSAKIFDVIFRLLTAKLLKDRSITSDIEINFSQPLQTLNAVQKYYDDKFSSYSTTISQSLLKELSTEIGNSFSFRNLSVDTLSYVYENTLVTSDSRKKLGIHSTPSYLADYILGQLPFEEIPRMNWKIGDTMCGHGIFLIAAMRRMRGLLPKDWGGKRRHEFFNNHLIGTDIDPLATEVARMCLTLADFPESNGWKINCQDVFKNNNLEKLISNVTILVGNPPFEAEENSIPKVPKPALLLRRALPLLKPGSLFGLVLPRSFLDGSDYRKEREQILNRFEIISITTLPDKIFKYADSETAVVVAKRVENPVAITTVYREVRDQTRKEFERNYQATWEDNVPPSYFIQKMESQLVVPFLREIWDIFSLLPTLADIADIKKGVEFETEQIVNNRNNIIRQNPFEGSKPAIVLAKDQILQFSVIKNVYIARGEEYHRKRAMGAWKLDWSKDKVVVPVSRMSRSAWRFVAAVDSLGRIATSRFFGIWPKTSNVSVETIAALLNSPIAQAFVYGYSSQRDIPKRIYQMIPVPKITEYQESVISSLVKDYIKFVDVSHKDAKNILLQIDAEILKLYALPPRLEKQLLNVFWGKQRSVPFEFKGYYPPDFNSWIPLHIYLSQQYRESTPKNILGRIPTIKPELIQYLKTVGTED